MTDTMMRRLPTARPAATPYTDPRALGRVSPSRPGAQSALDIELALLRRRERDLVKRLLNTRERLAELLVERPS